MKKEIIKVEDQLPEDFTLVSASFDGVNFFAASYDEYHKKWRYFLSGFVDEEIKFWKPLDKIDSRKSKTSKNSL